MSRSWGVGTFPPRQGDILVDFLFFLDICRVSDISAEFPDFGELSRLRSFVAVPT